MYKTSSIDKCMQIQRRSVSQGPQRGAHRQVPIGGEDGNVLGLERWGWTPLRTHIRH